MNHTQSGSQAVSTPKFCIKCGNGLAPGAKFCTKCGTPVQQTPPQEAVVWQAPVQEVPAQQTPPQEAVVWQAPVQEVPAQQTPPQEAVVQEAPTQIFSVQQEPSQEPVVWQAQEAPGQQMPPQEPVVWQAQETPGQQMPPQELAVWQAPAPEPPARQPSPQQPPARRVPPQSPPVQQAPKKKKSFFKTFLLVLAILLLVAVLALAACNVLAARGIIQIPDELNFFSKFGFSQSDSDKSGEEDQSSGDGSEEQPDDGQEADSSGDQEADYDINVWDTRFPAPPAAVYQQYYVIYYEGSQNNRIDMAVFDLDGALNGNYLQWDKTNGAIALKDYSAMIDCSRYCYDGESWVKDADRVRWISDAVTNVISSNLDIHDWDNDRLILSHITSAGISTPIDYSYYQPAEPGIQEYALPGSDSRYLTRDELAGFTADECRIARNEIYARHGRMFADEALQAYFNQFSWYVPQIRPEDFSDTMLNEYETANLALILDYEREMGYRQ